MSNYLLELAVIHGILALGYWFLLRKERQYGTLRMYWIVATVLAIVVPLLKLPQLVQSQQLAPQEVVSANTLTIGERDLPTYIATPKPTAKAETQTEARSDPRWVFLVLYVGVSAFFLIRMLAHLAKVVRLKRQSHIELWQGARLRRTHTVEGSFSFFGAVFLGKDLDPDQPEGQMILKHERAHAALGHTYDLLFFELFKVAFWWLPTAWLANREIRRLHEFQADAHVLKTCPLDQYSNTLIRSTLTQHGVGLVSTFHSNFIFKRLHAMKQQVTRIKPWKVGVLTSVSLILILLLAFTEERAYAQTAITADPEVEEAFTVIEEPPVSLGNLEEFWYFVDQNYPLIPTAYNSEVGGTVWIYFDVEEDGTVGEVAVSKGEDTEFETMVQELMQHMPDFRPGRQRGKSVRVSMKIELQFTNLYNDPNRGGMIRAPMEVDAQWLNVNAEFSKGVWEGTIYDKQRKPLAGVNISVPDTNIGAITDQNGRFRLEADASQMALASYV
ncbi:MAG TPA: hypothetical protein DCE41_12570, partial [Cytophagales bacterium]|nr:hypothetical protein [Cytophagales bacterium]